MAASKPEMIIFIDIMREINQSMKYLRQHPFLWDISNETIENSTRLNRKREIKDGGQNNRKYRYQAMKYQRLYLRFKGPAFK